MDERLSPPAARPEGAAHVLLRENCRYHILLALVMGGVFAACFVESDGWGINYALWAAAWCVCAHLALKKLGLARLARDGFWYGGIVLLGLSICWTANFFIQFVSACGCLILQCLWVLNVFADIRDWRFPKAAGAVIRLVFRSLARVFEPFRHLSAVRKTGAGALGHIALGLLIAVPLALGVTSLLSSADAVFRELLRSVFDGWALPDFFRVCLEALCFTFGAAAAFYAVLCAQTDAPEAQAQRPVKTADTLIAVTFTTVLALIYLLFCAIQVRVLFTGQADLLPKGWTYARYAREGFFQLLAVSGVNVALVIVSQRRFASSRALRALLCVISACTYVMEVSSAWRMALYVSAYGLTFLRVLVLWFLAVLGIILACAVATVFRPGFRLFRVCLAVCLGAWLIFAFARPDKIAAEYNIRRFGITESTVSCLRYDLSPDALETLRPYLNENRPLLDKYMDGYLDRGIPERYRLAGARGFNYSLWQANKTAEAYKNGQ